MPLLDEMGGPTSETEPQAAGGGIGVSWLRRIFTRLHRLQVTASLKRFFTWYPCLFIS